MQNKNIPKNGNIEQKQCLFCINRWECAKAKEKPENEQSKTNQCKNK